MAISEAQFQAEDDFRSLTNAEGVKSDSKRLGAAKRAGKKVVSREKKALAIKQRVAKPTTRKGS